MRIAIYVQDMRASGVVRTMIAMARAFEETDEAMLVAGYASGIFGAADVAPAGFVAAAERPKGKVPRLGAVPPLRRTLRELRPGVILSGGNFGHFSLWAATRGLGVPVVYVFSNAMEREGQPWRNRWRRFWSGLLVRGSGGAIVVGANLARSGVFAPHIASGKAVLIPNGIDLVTVPQADGTVPAAMAGPEPVILSIGRLQPQKNFEALIDAVAVVRKTHAVRLVVLGAGTDDYRAALIARAEARGIAGHVLFAGTTDNVYPWLRAARVFALASRWEGSSIALLEAMAAGTPIVASRTAGDAADVLDDGRYGLIADAENPQAFAAALLRQIDDPVMPGDRAQAYDAPVMMRAYHAMLTKAAAGARARAARA
ncbi:glycosyltransferase [Sphingomonas sp. CGMCC 1.13654]|uniref:Glycosyltransferase n=1 Tax=Sphingomonas chungangi TaxID=2683589 RepID=A0A838L535_9SPHN|nr:glycosyltransferase [Sphingomonas chungangi]MBA2934137.1 glycosyltransferase [Sphingomonas chungangi]MVW57178.1 glycosyltransferase [Sphingomonas chungangi]